MTRTGFDLSARLARRGALVLLVTVAPALAAPTPAAAHHGWSAYLTEEFVLVGVVEAVYLGNPHGELQVRDAEGQVWDVVLGPPFRNSRAGIEDGAVRVGDEVTAHGNRHRDPAVLEMKTRRLEKGGTAFQIY